eukprot:c20492_g1_i1 orf=613-3051(+)
MECNRDEALRSKVLAETKFSQRDFVGARKFAHKAKQLYPELEGIAQFISVLDVHIVAQNKLQGGETNWYGILEVDPVADENTIRKQYRKLALLLHPDKNKSVGAEAAFKHISEAWTVLSDKNKKAAYDARCQGRMPPPPSARPPQPNCAPNNVSKPPPPPSMPTFVPPIQRRAQAQAQPQTQAAPVHPQATAAPPPAPPPAVPPSKPRPSPPFAPPIPNNVSFWTSCPSCKMLLEYQRIYLHKNLCCPVCYKPFIATEVVAVSGTLLWPPPPKQHKFRVEAFTTNGYVPTSGANGGFPIPQFGSFPFGNVNVGPAAYPTPSDNVSQKDKPEIHAKSRKPTPEIQQKVEERIMGVQAKLKKHFMEAQGQNPAEPKQKVPKRNLKEELKAKAAAHAKEVFNRLMAKSKGVIEQKLSAEKEKKVKLDGIDQPPKADLGSPSRSKVSPRQTITSNNSNGHGKNNGGLQGKQFFADKNESATTGTPTTASRKSTKGKRASSALDHDTHDSSPSSKKLKEDPDAMPNGKLGTSQNSKPPQDSGGNVMSKASPRGSTRTSPSLRADTESTKEAAAMDLNVMPVVDDAITVPDAEFYEFDKDRTENHFLAGQIWAAYDDDDGMPRYYARVNKVISSQPFKIQIAWLEARSSSDETLAWLDAGLSLTCGDFRLGKALTSEHINMYSHVMRFEKGHRGGFKIYPQQGDIWALYKDWDTLKAKDKKTGYIIVEVLTDFKEEEGVQVCQLEKLDGFKTLFQRRSGEEHLEWIHVTSDLRRFSHQVPAYRLTPAQVPGIKEGCWELDPASTPLELISAAVGEIDQ